MVKELKKNNMARTKKSRGAAPFQMRTGNSPIYKDLGSSFQPPKAPSYDYKFGGDSILPETDDSDMVAIDDSKTEKVKPQDIKIADTGKTGSTSSRPSGEEFVTSDPDTEPTATAAAESSGMSDATKATIIGEIGKIGEYMQKDAARRQASSKSFGDIRSAFGKKKKK